MEDDIFFNQSKYIKEILKKFGLEDSKPMKTPMSSDTKLTKDEERESVDSTKYQGMIGLRFAYLKNLTAFCLKISLCFASRPHCVLLQDIHCVLLEDLTAFCLKTSLGFASRPHCVLLQGKENGLQILPSIAQGPFELRTTRDTLGTTSEGDVLLGPERPRTYDDSLMMMKKKRYDADVRATTIIRQGLPKGHLQAINHNKLKQIAIMDNVKMLLAGSELTKEDRESQLYDEFERFRMLPGENINEYYVCFHKLVNDMRNIRMTMPNIQLNSKFVNNMSPEWG
ncbi:hypothetical protein Tco_0859285 [Tanacetum coccineum]|uniref:Retrovirus-related Pol polyprotein from transposon TNT 1-94 n=1 Tax=Tanacetum coccineum TaxID=301880 RepID=A0ABQ5BFH6_9ASTR